MKSVYVCILPVRVTALVPKTQWAFCHVGQAEGFRAAAWTNGTIMESPIFEGFPGRDLEVRAAAWATTAIDTLRRAHEPNAPAFACDSFTARVMGLPQPPGFEQDHQVITALTTDMPVVAVQ